MPTEYAGINEDELHRFVSKWVRLNDSPTYYYLRARVGKTSKRAKKWRFANIDLVIGKLTDQENFCRMVAMKCAERAENCTEERDLWVWFEVVEHAGTEAEASIEFPLPERAGSRAARQEREVREQWGPDVIIRAMAEVGKDARAYAKMVIDDESGEKDRLQREVENLGNRLQKAEKEISRLLIENVKVHAELTVAKTNAGYDPMMMAVIEHVAPQIAPALGEAWEKMQRYAEELKRRNEAKAAEEARKKAEEEARRATGHREQEQEQPETPQAEKAQREPTPEEQAAMTKQQGELFDEVFASCIDLIVSNPAILTQDRWDALRIAATKIAPLAAERGIKLS